MEVNGKSVGDVGKESPRRVDGEDGSVASRTTKPFVSRGKMSYRSACVSVFTESAWLRNGLVQFMTDS